MSEVIHCRSQQRELISRSFIEYYLWLRTEMGGGGDSRTAVIVTVYGKTRPKSPGKIGRKRGKREKN
jgi:hypothetical protein